MTSVEATVQQFVDGLNVHDELVRALRRALSSDPEDGVALFNTCMNRWTRYRRREDVVVALRVARTFPGQIPKGRVQGAERVLASPARPRRGRAPRRRMVPDPLIANGPDGRVVVMDLRGPYTSIPRR